jgi:flagellin
VGAVTAGGDAIGQGANLAAAINLVSAQSGVSASAHITTGAVTLTSADGRDVSIGLSGTAANNAAASANKTAFLTQTGFVTGTVGTQATVPIAAVGQVIGSVNFGHLTVVPGGSNGSVANLTFSFNGGAFQAVPSFATGPDSTTTGANFAAAINSVLPGTAVSNFGDVDPVGGTITFAIGGTAVDLATANANQAALIAQTGLDATQLGMQAYGGAAGAGATTVNNHGGITLSSNNTAGIVVSGGAPANAGLTAGTTAASTTFTIQALATVDIKTATSAANALAAIDGALANVNSSRANLGAVQNRFTSVVASLQTTSENLTASRSRIQDADFAQETAALTRAQVLQQAGTAILAQANALPQGVLALLR